MNDEARRLAASERTVKSVAALAIPVVPAVSLAVRKDAALASAAGDRPAIASTARHLDWKTKLAYAPTGAAETLAVNSVTQLVNPVFAITLGMSPGLVGIAMAVPRLWDAFTNPIVGSLSDNWRGRWGRRRPFIAVGSIASALCVAGLWWAPAGRSDQFYFTWLLVVGLFLATSIDLLIVPYTALGLELAERREERTTLMAWRSFFSKLAGVGVQWLFALVQLAVFAGVVNGARVIGVAVGVIILVVGLLPALFCRERSRAELAAVRRVSLLASWRDTLHDRRFLLLAGANICVYTSVLLVETVGLYLNIYYVCRGDIAQAAVLKGLSGTAFHLAGIAALPGITYLASRYGKPRAFLLCTASIMLGGIAKWFCYFPGAGTWVALPSILLGPGLVAVLVLVPSMVGDLCVDDARRTGARREGMYSAVLTWIFKLSNAVVLFFSGLLLVAIGWENTAGAAQAPETFWWMRVCFVVATVVLALMGVGALRAYRSPDFSSTPCLSPPPTKP